MASNEIINRIRRIRRAKGLKQADVAKVIGVTASEVSRIERGVRRFPIHLLEPWCQALGVRAELLFWDDGELEAGVSVLAGDLDEESRAIIREVAAGLPHMPPPARAALLHQVRAWRHATDVDRLRGRRAG